MRKYPVYDDCEGAKRDLDCVELRGNAATKDEAIAAGQKYHDRNTVNKVVDAKRECVEQEGGEKVECWILCLEADLSKNPNIPGCDPMHGTQT